MEAMLAELEAETAEVEGALGAMQAGGDSLLGQVCGPWGHYMLFVLGWTNVLAAGLFASGVSHGAIDAWLCVYPVLNGAHWALEASVHGGPIQYLSSRSDPTLTSGRKYVAFFVVLSLFGMVCLLARHAGNPSDLPENIERAFVASTVFLVFTRRHTISPNHNVSVLLCHLWPNLICINRKSGPYPNSLPQPYP